MEDITRHYLISGRVQGVGFRAFTSRKANELGLRGWVRNLHDGRVEVFAQGSTDSLLALESHLKFGPAHGEVESVVVTVCNSTPQAPKFEVRKDSD